MCLRTITKRVEKPSKKITKAWKIFLKNLETGELSNYYYGWVQPIKQGRWLKAVESSLKTDGLEDYTSGFHCYTNRKQMEEFHREELNRSYLVIVEVKVKEITLYGTQWASSPCGVIVARQMLVPKQ